MSLQVLALIERQPEPPARRVCAPTGGVYNWTRSVPYQVPRDACYW
jgi:hypothetical protein